MIHWSSVVFLGLLTSVLFRLPTGLIFNEPSGTTTQIPETTVPIDSLAFSISKNANTDLEKIESFYQFVTREIAYDHEAYQNGRRRINQSNADVLRRKKAVCWGYAQLITELCTHVQIPCYTITGYAKDSPLPRRAFEKANHAWNAVKIDESWFLLDATWGRSLLAGENIFSLEYGIDYFLSDPTLFIKSHFPLMPMWQLLECPVSYRDFLSNIDTGQTEPCRFSFVDSIQAFQNLDYLDQQLKIMTTAYHLNNTKTNRAQIGHALVDLAIAKKEKGDLMMESDSFNLARELLAAASDFFTVANHYASFYPWQRESQLFTEINLAQVSYQLMEGNASEGQLVRERFQKAQELLEIVTLPSDQESRLRTFLSSYLTTLNEWLDPDPPE